MCVGMCGGVYVCTYACVCVCVCTFVCALIGDPPSLSVCVCLSIIIDQGIYISV